MPDALLRVDDLHTHFFTLDGVTRAVDGVDLVVHAGETLGIVGESGCGKSVTALSIMRLLPVKLGRVVSGTIRFDGEDLLALSEAEMREIRGNRIAMVFQEPMTSLNPVLTIGDQIAEAVMIHQKKSRSDATAHAVKMLRLVRISDAERRVRDYPHQFSGGMRQRVMIAMALCCNPKLLIADEPTTALDVTIQAQILELMRDLREETGAAIILITHDLGVIAEMAHDVAVMYAGRIVERANVNELFARPQHPYTIGLLGSIPKLYVERETLATIQGQVPNPAEMPRGCRFMPRCPFATDKCRTDDPPLMPITARDEAACWYAPLEEKSVAAA
jgi:oligopeptide/dipeptide ABC transporter ATP-binding protein